MTSGNVNQLPDRGYLTTEQRLAASAQLDQLSVLQTLQVINEQDAQLTSALATALPQIAQVVERVVAGLRQGGRLIYLGAGTSGRLGVLDASECPPTFHCPPGLVVGLIAGGDTALRKSSEGAEDDFHGAAAELKKLALTGRDVVLGIAAGGSTPYVLGGLTFARGKGAATALLCCVPAAQAPNPCPADVLIALPVGPEVLTGSTRMKAGTATKMALNMISTTAMVQLGKAWGNLMVDLKASNDKLRDRAIRILTQQCALSRGEALALLERAGGKVKPALIMARRGVTLEQAVALLDEHQQHLRPIIGPPR